MRAFPIGFWNYVAIENQDASAVKDWVDAGVTLTMGPLYGAGQADRMRSILDACQEAGIRIILCDQRSSWRTLESGDKEGYRAGMAQAIAELGDHPAVLGFHVGDEPGTGSFPCACQAMRIQKEMAPHLTPFLNLLPWYPGVEQRVGYARWADYLDAYAREAAPEFLCYDCYSQMNPGTEGWEMYFTNLREFQEAGARHGIPFWTTLLSVGHFRYRCPKEDDIRWQVNTALAHGAAGLLWFFFYMRTPHENYRVSPIDEHYERTETYDWLSRVCRTFLKSTAPVMTALTLSRVRHVGQAWGGTPLMDETGLVVRAASSTGTPLIVSEFKHTGGADYVMIVNNSQTESTQATLQVRGDRPQLHAVGWLAKESPVGETQVDWAGITAWLAPGQMALYRVENAPDAAAG